MSPGQAGNTNRIALNTTLLYTRMIVVMIINLYTVRLVLGALGVTSYGVYDVVAGLIYVMASVSNVLATATQRYFATALGKQDPRRFQDVFSASLVLYAALTVAVLVLGETVGLWFVNHALVIPDEQLRAANVVYQLSIATFLFGIVHLPYSSAIIAHEHLGVYSAISVAESVMKLVAALAITRLRYDYLIVHGGLLLAVSVVVALAFAHMATRKYAACRFRYPEDPRVFRELIAFSGWSLFGSVAGVGLVQVITVMVNMFFGPAVSAARAISLQLSNAVTVFTGSLMTAVRPSMIKSYTEQSFDYLNRIFNLSNKFIFFGLMMICLPLLFEMEAILALWLGAVDAQAILFSRLIVVYALIMALNNPISVVIQATGHVKEYHLIVEPFTLLCVPATYALFALGLPAYTTYLAMITAAVLSHLARLWCLKRYYREFDLSAYIHAFVVPSFGVLAIVIGGLSVVHVGVEGVVLRLGLQVLLAAGLTLPLAYALAMTPDERALLRQIRLPGIGR